MLWLVGVLCAGAAAYAYLFVAPLLFYTDNYVYLLLGEAWASGQGQTNIWTGLPIPHRQYPPGYPMLLGLAMRLGLESVTAFKLVNGVLFGASIGLAYGWGRRVVGDREAAMLACAFIALNVALLRFASLVMTEIPFVASTLLALYALARSRSEQLVWRDGWFWLMIASTIASFYIRSVGVALAFAVGVGLAFERRWGRAALASAVTFAAWLPWWLRGRELGSTYSSYFTTWIVPGDAGASAAALVRRVAGNVWGYLSVSFPEALTPAIQPVIDLAPVLAACCSVLALAAAFWGWKGLRQDRAVVGVYLLATTALHLIWPVHWNTYRFVLPVVPVLTVLATWGGLRAAGAVLSRGAAEGAPRPGPASAVLGLPLLLLVLPGLYVAKNWDGHRPSTLEIRHLVAAEWVQDHVPEGAAAIAAARPATVHYLTRRYVGAPRSGATPEETIAMLRADGFGYVLVTANRSDHPIFARVVPAIEAHPEQFELLEAIARPDSGEGAYPYYTALYRILPEPEADEAAAYGP